MKETQQQVVYFIQIGDDGPVKIGIARDIAKRMDYVMTCNPYPVVLRAVISGGRSVERALHERFAAHRIRGEWFEPHREIMDAINSAPKELLKSVRLRNPRTFLRMPDDVAAAIWQNGDLSWKQALAAMSGWTLRRARAELGPRPQRRHAHSTAEARRKGKLGAEARGKWRDQFSEHMLKQLRAIWRSRDYEDNEAALKAMDEHSSVVGWSKMLAWREFGASGRIGGRRRKVK